MEKKYLSAFITVRDSLIALIFWLLIGSPIVLIAALISRFHFKHPFYYEKRVGRNGVEEEICKLRTMDPPKRKLPAGKSGTQKQLYEKERIPNSFYKFLRFSKIDEFPQALKVVEGKWRIFGTRIRSHDEIKDVKFYAPRDAGVRPGLLSPEQIGKEKSKATYTAEDAGYIERDYLDKKSFMYDTKILLVYVPKAICRNLYCQVIEKKAKTIRKKNTYSETAII